MDEQMAERVREAARMSREVRSVFAMELEEAGEQRPMLSLFGELNMQVCAKLVELELHRMYEGKKK